MSESTQRCVCCLGDRTKDYVAGLVKCCSCGHVWADTRLSDGELRELYAGSYFEDGEYLDYAGESKALRRNFARRVRELAKRHPKGTKLWEIGAAYGFFLDEAGTHFDAAGCDISEHAVAAARDTLGIEVCLGDYLDLDTGGPFDAICLWDTVEHLREPHLYLEKAVAELRPGGTLALSTGDIGSLNARLRGANWRLIHPPTHLHYFCEHSITILLARLGFQQTTVRHLPFWRSADNTAYQILTRLGAHFGPSIHNALKKTRLLNFYFPLNMGDLMTVYATKATEG